MRGSEVKNELDEDLTTLERTMMIGAFILAGLIVVWCLFELAELIAITIAAT